MNTYEPKLQRIPGYVLSEPTVPLLKDCTKRSAMSFPPLHGGGRKVGVKFKRKCSDTPADIDNTPEHKIYLS